METAQYELTTGGYWTQWHEAEAASFPEALRLAGLVWEESERKVTVQIWEGQTLLVTFEPAYAGSAIEGDDDE